MERTPLFMTKSPKTLEEVEANPQLKAIQSIVNDYEPDGEEEMCILLTLQELAEYSKNHGNAAFTKGRTAKEKFVNCSCNVFFLIRRVENTDLLN